MEFPPFASLGHVRILVVPVGNIKKQAFDKWANIVRSFETIRLGDISPHSRDDYGRFMPAALSPGYLHLSYPSHPPPLWHAPLGLFRPSEFPLGIIGIAQTSSSLTSILSQFNAEVAQLFSANPLFPLAQNCYVFEDEGNAAPANLGESHPGMVVIPNVMGNKEVYIGTLVSELCSSILAEFSNLARAVESSLGMEILNSTLFPIIPGLSDQSLHEQPGPTRNSQFFSQGGVDSPTTSEPSSRSATPVLRASTFDAGRPVPSHNLSLAASVASKSARRQSGITIPQTGRLFKLLGDLFLLAGRNSDAGVWYTKSASLLNSPHDAVWNASALEGLCTVQVLEAWNAGHGLVWKESWLDISEKLSQAATLYSRATPSVGTSSPEVDSSLIILLYTNCVTRHASLLFSIWASKGWGPLAFVTLIRPGLPLTFTPTPPDESHRIRLSTITGISRATIANTLAQAHGPFLLHLEPHDRIRLLQHMAATYSCLGFRRKEVYVLRELLSTVMDVLVCNRDEAMKTAREKGSGMPALNSKELRTIGFRERENAEGNESIMELVRYVCEVYGIDLTAVKLLDSDVLDDIETTADTEMPEMCKSQFGWDELQLGVVREAVAIVEALPDYATVAQFDLSALRTLHAILSPLDQTYLYTNSTKALVTARRRGDDRRIEFWSGNPIVNIEISPLSFVRLPIEHQAKDLLPPSEEADAIVGNRDPFIYNPRLVASISKSQAFIVQNEPIEFVLTLKNPYAFDLELQSLSLSTSGVSLEADPSSVTIAANSYHVTRIIATATEPGTLVVRGCLVQAHGGMPREFVFPLTTEEANISLAKRKSAWQAEVDRIKETGLDARPWIRNKRLSLAKPKISKTSKGVAQMSFIQCTVVPQQPLMRIRRTSLTHGAVMMYDGETSFVRLTVENVSTIPIEFIKVTCIDSTMAPAQQALAEGELSVFETYETEYELLRRPVFRWDQETQPKSIGPGKKAIITIICSGKIGCTSGSVQISYSNIRQESLTQYDVFHTRQVIYPVLVTVYNTLECHNMDILPFTSESPQISGAENAQAHCHIGKRPFEDKDGEWCLFTVDVRNTYGMPFEVTLERQEDGEWRCIPEELSGLTTRLVSPGSTSRIILPIKRFLLSETQLSTPIPTLSDRQFVVSKSKLTSKEERHQRELFWYREALFSHVKGKWREAGGSRFGWLSLRQQRFTALMLDALRTDRSRLKLSLVSYNDSGECCSLVCGSKTTTGPDRFVYLRATVVNQTPDPMVMTLSFTVNPSEHVLYDGVICNIPVGELSSGEERQMEIGLCFVSEGKFDLRATVNVIGDDPNTDSKTGEGELRVIVRSDDR
ncbi:TRAPP II complex [Hysterangium stoloniferum]|nr:TRAPP II complex [Hysterangium stoloniferum]